MDEKSTSDLLQSARRIDESQNHNLADMETPFGAKVRGLLRRKSIKSALKRLPM
jgi:hypothetical protein